MFIIAPRAVTMMFSVSASALFIYLKSFKIIFGIYFDSALQRLSLSIKFKIFKIIKKILCNPIVAYGKIALFDIIVFKYF